MSPVLTVAVSLVVTWLSFAALLIGLVIHARREGRDLYIEIEVYHRRVFSYHSREPSEGGPS